MRTKTILGVGLLAFLALSVVCITRHAPKLASSRASAIAPASLRAAWGASGASLSGSLSGASADAVTRAAKAAFGVNRVSSAELRVGSVDELPGLPALPVLLKTLAGALDEGVFELDSRGIKVSGAVGSAREREDLVARIRGLADPKVRIFEDIAVVTLAEPPVVPSPSAEGPRPSPTPKPAGDLQSRIDDIVGDRTIEFALGKAALTPRGRRVLDDLVPLLKKNPRVRIQVSGHTDAWGGAKHNKLLSQKRADAVVQYFVRKGLDRRRFTAVGYGESRPKTKGASPADIARNRRIEIRVKKGK